MTTGPPMSAKLVNVRGTKLLAGDTRAQYRQKLARIMLDSMVQFVGLLDADGTVLEINHVALDAVGSTLSDVEGKPFWETFWWQVSEGINTTLKDSIRRAAQGEFVRWDTVIYGRAGGRETIVIDASLTPVRDEHGKVVFITAEGRDITQRKALEREVNERAKAEDQLRQLQKMEAVAQLTGGVAHDFNNMLAVVIGALSLVQHKLAKGETDVERFLAGAIDGAERAAALTQRLLAFSRRQPLAPQRLDLNKLVAGMIELLGRTLGEAIHIETAPGIGLWPVRADPGQLENAILELSANAGDAMPDGGKLTIEASNALVDETFALEYAIAPGEYVQVAVADSGTGMAPDMIAKAFDPFFTTKGEGTGLGLSQVYGFVCQSGGHVTIHSELGIGTTVTIYLPRGYDEAGTFDPLSGH
jgi:PAS domain S-box-containing protein